MVNLGIDLDWNYKTKELLYKNKKIALSKSEMILLYVLVKNINTPISCEQLYVHIYGWEKEVSIQSIRVLVSKLRKKLPYKIIENIYGGDYIIKNVTIGKNTLSDLNNYLYDVLDQLSHGVVLTDPNQEDNPVIYVNKAFLKTFKLDHCDIIGKNCRVLQHNNTNQDNKRRLKEAIRKQTPVTVELTNYKKDLSAINIELTVNPIFDKKKNRLKYFIGLQKVL